MLERAEQVNVILTRPELGEEVPDELPEQF